MNTKRFFRTIFLALAAGALVLVAAAAIFLNSTAFRNFLRSELQRQVAEAGARLDIGAIEPRWTHLSLRLGDIVVHGQEAQQPGVPPLLRAKSLFVSVRFVPLLRRDLQFREIILDQPEVHLKVDANGNTNLPASSHQGNSGAFDRVFRLHISDCSIRSGEIYYNDFQLPLDAHVHGMNFDAHTALLERRFAGSLSYDNGDVNTRGFALAASRLHLQFSADPAGISLNPLTMESGASTIQLNARMSGYANPQIDGTYSATLQTADAARALNLPSLPSAEASTEGSLAYAFDANRTFLESLTLRGAVRSPSVRFRTGKAPLAFTSVNANYSLARANLTVRDISGAVLGGDVHGNLEMSSLASAKPQARLTAALQNLSASKAAETLTLRESRQIALAGTAKAQVEASWVGSLQGLLMHLQVDVTSARQFDPATPVIPLNGHIQADYDGARNRVALGQSYLQTARTKITAGGTLSPQTSGHAEIDLLATTADLGEAQALVSLIQGAATGTPGMALPHLGGSAEFRATINGTVNSPEIRGQLAARHLSFDGSQFASLDLNVRANPSYVSVSDGLLLGSPGERISFTGSSGLQHWSLGGNSPVSLHATASDLSVADAEKLAQLPYPVTGTLAGDITLKGTRDRPQANGTIALTKASAWNEPIDNLTVRANSDGGVIHATGNMRAPAGGVSMEASWNPATSEYQVSARGANLQLAKISALERAPSLQGAADLTINGAGTTQNPSLQATLSTPKLAIRDQTASNVSAQVVLANHHANITLHSIVYQGTVEARADVDLTGNRYTTADVNVRNLPLAPVLVAFASAKISKVEGETEIHMNLRGPLDNPAQMQGHLEIPVLRMGYGKAEIALAQPLRADYRDGDVTLAPARIEGTGTHLTLEGRIPIRSASSYSLSADGSVDLGMLQQFAPDVRSSGQILVHVRSAPGSQPSAVQGELQLKDAVLSTESFPAGIEGLNAQIRLTGNRADVSNLSGTVGGGSVSGGGFLTFGKQSNFSLALTAKSVRIRYPDGLRSVLSGQLNFQGSPEASALTGKILVDRLSFTQAFDLSNIAGYFSEDSSATTSSAFEGNVKLAVAVQSSNNLNLASSKLSMGGTANLNLTGTLADPIVLGRIALTNGEVFFLGKRFEVQSGTIQFANPARTNPVLNLHVTTTIEQYNVTMNLQGPVDRLKTTYTSDPALPPADIIHLLAFGKTAEESAAASATSAATSAESVLAQGVGSQVAGKLENLTGISQLTIDPLAANSQGNPGAQVAVQERITGSLLLTFSTDVTSTQSQTVQLQYQFNRRLSVSVLRDKNGGYGIDLRMHKEF